MENFSKDPTYRNSEYLTLWQKLLFYTWSTYSVEEKKGNIEKAREIRKILSPELKKFICLDIRGLRSILLGCKLLLQLNQKKMTHMDIYIGNNKSFEVYYNYDKDLPGMFFVNQTDKDFGVDKELSLYYEGIVDYFKDMFRNFNSKKVSKIKFVISDREKPFYSEKLGVIWNEEDCADCALQSLKGEVTSEKCKQLIIKRCYDSFRHSPLLEINIIEKTKKIDDPNQWDAKPPSKENINYDEKYDSYYDDYSVKFDYDNSTDVDYYYYYDTSDDDKKDSN